MSAGKNGAAASHLDGCILMRRNQQEKKAMGTIVLWCRTFFCVLDTHTHTHARTSTQTNRKDAVALQADGGADMRARMSVNPFACMSGTRRCVCVCMWPCVFIFCLFFPNC